MPNPSGRDRRAEARNIETDASSILASTTAKTQSPNPRSANLSPQDSERLLYQPLPHVDELTKQQWTKERSLKLDFWLQYSQLEFEFTGRQA